MVQYLCVVDNDLLHDKKYGVALQWKSIIALSYIKVLAFFLSTLRQSVGAVYCGNFLYPVIVTVQNLGRVGIEL